MKSNSTYLIKIILVVLTCTLISFGLSLLYVGRPYVYSAFIQNTNPLPRAEVMKDIQDLQNVLNTPISFEGIQNVRLSMITPYLYQIEIFTDRQLKKQQIEAFLTYYYEQWQMNFQLKVNQLRISYVNRITNVSSRLNDFNNDYPLSELQSNPSYLELTQEFLFLLLSLDQIDSTTEGYLLNLNYYYEHFDPVELRLKERYLPLTILLSGFLLILGLALLKYKEGG